MRDEDDAVATRLRLGQHVEDLRLDRGVQGRRRFVGDQEFRILGERGCDEGALAETAGEFVGTLTRPDPRFGDAHEVEQLDDSFLSERPPEPLRGPAADPTVRGQRFGDLAAHRA